MAIADTIQSMTENLESSYDVTALSEIDMTGVNKNLQNLPDTIKRSYLDIMNNGYSKVWDNWEKVTGEGTSLTLNNTEQALIKMDLKGNTSQTGTPTPDTPIPVNVVSGDNSVVVCGKNLLNLSEISRTVANVTYTSSNSALLINGTKQGADAVLLSDNKVHLTAGTYTVSTTVLSGSTSGSQVNELTIRNSNNVAVSSAMSNFAKGNNLSFTITNEGDYYIRFYIVDGFSFSNLLLGIQIEKGSSTTYEPYKEATYPINLPVENLLGLQDVAETTTDGITYSVSNGELSISGTKGNSGNVNIPLIQNVTLTSGTTYTYSCVLSGTLSKNINVDLVGGDTRIIGTRQDTLPVTGSSYSGTATTIRLYIAYGTVFTDFKMKLQLSLGSKANSFTPYGTTPIELCKIGDYQDYFLKENDKWYKYKFINKYIFDGSADEYWSLQSTNYFRTGDFIDTQLDTLYCNMATYITLSNLSANTDNRIAPAASRLWCRFSQFNNNIDTFKTYLTTNNMLVYTMAKTPTKEEITYQPLIEQLNNLEKAMSYNGQTNISQVNNDLPFIISASALKEWSV